MTMGDRVVVMREGVVQQVGEPQAVYDQPANTFVATFIGSPAMSLFPGQVQADNGALDFVAPALRVPLGDRIRHALARQLALEGQVTLGVRSEHVQVSPQPSPDGVEARILFIEPIGSDMYVSLTVGEQHCVARTEPRTDLEEGQPVWLCLPPDRLHLFDAQGRNVLAASASAPAAIS
jgi:multiple sugar transport system ATP-binding protein